MEELKNNIELTVAEFLENFRKNIDGNKSAGVRARKNTLELERYFRQYRKESVSHGK